MSTDRKLTPMTRPPTEHDPLPMGANPAAHRPVPRAPADGDSGPGAEVIPAPPSTHPGGPAPGPGGSGRDAKGPADQAARLPGAEDGDDFVSRVVEDFEEGLAELVCRIALVAEDGHLDAGRRRALFGRIAASGPLLVELVDAVDTDLGPGAR
jgi:hypothetical protein